MDDQTILRATGSNGTIHLSQDKVHITRNRLTGAFYGTERNVELRISEIDALELGTALGGLAGFLSIHDKGGRDGYQDLCVSFFKYQQPAFEAIKQELERRMHALHVDTEGAGFRYLPVNQAAFRK